MFYIYILNHFLVSKFRVYIHKFSTLCRQIYPSLRQVTNTFSVIVFLNYSMTFVSHFTNLFVPLCFLNIIHLFLIKQAGKDSILSYKLVPQSAPESDFCMKTVNNICIYLFSTFLQTQFENYFTKLFSLTELN